MKSKLWNGSFLRTVLLCLAITCAVLLALSAICAGLVLGGVAEQKALPAAACVISFTAVFLGSFLAAKHASGQKLPAALAVAGTCLIVCLFARLLFFGNADARLVPGVICMVTASLLAGILGSTHRKNPRRRRR